MTGHFAKETQATVIRITSLRLAVGLLGERDVAGWWMSGFTSPTSTAFLTPVFGRRALQARYQGVLEAARRVHDDRIGVGRALHPFRLPEPIEQRIHEALHSDEHELAGIVSSPDEARIVLDRLAGAPVQAKEGPTLMGLADMLDGTEWVAGAAALYSSAFAAGIQCFPYFRDAR